MNASRKIILGAGCFWGVQAVYDLLDGIIQTSVGYCGGNLQNPTYQEVCTKNTGHYEVVKIEYDENKIKLKNLIDLFFFIHDPTQIDGQGNDIGPQYLSVIFAPKEEHQEISLLIEKLQNDYKGDIATKLLSPSIFYAAEEYHQQYLIKNPGGYCHINMSKVKDFLETRQFRLK